MRRFLIASFCALVVSGCATVPQGSALADDPSELPSIQTKYAAKLAEVKPGMTLNDFKSVFPQAYVGGQSGNVTAYEVSRLVKYVTSEDIKRHNIIWGVGSPEARVVKQSLWFYFADGKLVRWGRPQDWPDQTTVIVQKRER